MRLIDSLLLLIAPEIFIARATKHGISHELRRHKQLAAEFPDGELPEDHQANIENSVRTQTQVIRKSIFSSIAITLMAILFAIGTGVLLRNTAGPPAKLITYTLQALGASVILGATLAEAGRKIETYSRSSLSEEVNASVSRVLYVIGTFLFVVSVAWDAA